MPTTVYFSSISLPPLSLIARYHPVEKSNRGIGPVIGVGPLPEAVGTALEVVGGLTGDALAQIDPVGSVLGSSQYHFGEVEIAWIEIDLSHPIFRKLLFHPVGGQLDRGQISGVDQIFK